MIKVKLQNKKMSNMAGSVSLERSYMSHRKLSNEENEAVKWAKENKAAIEEYNERIKKYGAFGDGFRSF
jgi:post-segregation antitoxin (ccd killing protein)